MPFWVTKKCLNESAETMTHSVTNWKMLLCFLAPCCLVCKSTINVRCHLISSAAFDYVSELTFLHSGQDNKRPVSPNKVKDSWPTRKTFKKLELWLVLHHRARSHFCRWSQMNQSSRHRSPSRNSGDFLMTRDSYIENYTAEFTSGCKFWLSLKPHVIILLTPTWKLKSPTSGGSAQDEEIWSMAWCILDQHLGNQSPLIGA